MNDSINTYENAKREKKIAELELERLLNKKEELKTKCFPVTQVVTEKRTSKDKSVYEIGSTKPRFSEYATELLDDKENLKSLDTLITEQENKVSKHNKIVNEMKNILLSMTGIEYELYLEIAFLGCNPTQAVKKIASKRGQNERTIWRKYDKIKILLKK